MWADEAVFSGDGLIARWPAARPFLLIGSACIITGGVIAAVTRPTGFELGPWVAAYLVLVGGVAQIALGVGQAALADEPPRQGELRAEMVTWNLGVVATIVGTLVPAPILTTLGGIASMVALALFLRSVRRASRASGWARILYRGVASIVLISIPVGLALAWIRHG